jgi:hypothetical protein
VDVPVGPAGIVAAHWYAVALAVLLPVGPVAPLAEDAITLNPDVQLTIVDVLPPTADTGLVAVHK